MELLLRRIILQAQALRGNEPAGAHFPGPLSRSDWALNRAAGVKAASRNYRSGLGHHSRASFSASVTCAVDISDERRSRAFAAPSRSSFSEASKAARLNHTCACT